MDHWDGIDLFYLAQNILMSPISTKTDLLSNNKLDLLWAFC